MNKFDFLHQEPGPPMLLVSLKHIGIKEIPGEKSNPIILGWAAELGISAIYKNDDIAWCALDHAIICVRAGYKETITFTGYDLLRAKSWLQWGWKVVVPMLGDTLVFKRPQGYHVGLYVGESKSTFHVLGGNQGNQHGFTEIAKSRLAGARRPTAYCEFPPSNIRTIYLGQSGAISQNEA